MSRVSVFTCITALSTLLAGCQNPFDSDSETVSSLVFSIDPYILSEEGPATRTALEGTSFKWAPGDTVGIYPNTGSQVYFELTAGEGASSAEFDGGGWAFKSSSVYYSYYPFIGNIYLKRNHIPVSYLGQKQKGTLTEHIGPYDFMYTNPSEVSAGLVSFSYHHLNCIIRPRLIGLPAGTYTKLAITANAEVFPTKGYYNLIAESPAIIPTHYTNQLVIDLENFSVETGKEYMVYIMSAPIAVKDTDLTISILNSQKKEYQCKKTPTADYFAGEIKGLKCDSFTEVPQSMGLIIDDWGDGGNIGGDAE